jgi:predicted transcriptional regulator
VSHHTLEKILQGKQVRRKTLAKIVNQLYLYREIEKTVNA